MHMSDALLSPIVGVAMFGVTATCMAVSISRLNCEDNINATEAIPSFSSASSRIPLMGIMAAFVFAAQMINFSIPGTGSSGHIGGGLLLAAILGPWAGFLSISTVLIIQSFFFADGGLLALGANIFNMGFFPCFLAYPLLFQTLLKTHKQRKPTRVRLTYASTLSVVFALQMGAFSVVLQTLLSGKTALPFVTFVLYMQPIHLAIGLVEGLVTAAVLLFVMEVQPDMLHCTAIAPTASTFGKRSKWIPIALLCLALVMGGIGSWFASSNPDGLEWSMEKTAGTTELKAEGPLHTSLAALQGKTAFLPDYDFQSGSIDSLPLGTTTSGIIGVVLALLVMVAIGFGLLWIRKRTAAPRKSST